MSTLPRAAQILLVGQRIRQLRKSRRLTQADLASQIGIAQSDLSRMENGEYKVGLDTLFRILQVFELSMSSFFEEAAPEADEAGGVDSPDLEHNDEREQLLSDWTELSEDGRREVREFISFKRMQTESRRPSTPLGAQIPQDSASPIASTVKAPHWKPDHGLLATGLTVVKRSPTARPAESVASVEDSERQDGRDVSKTDGGASDVRG